MSWKNSENRYGALSISMHWLMVVLMIFVFASIECRVFFEKGTETRDLFKMWHFMLGLSVLVLVVARIYLRISQITPKITPMLSTLQHTAAKLGHIVLYTFMVIMPIMGWLILSAEGKVIPFFGLELPPLVSPDKALGHDIEELHETFGLVGYYLIALHALAALVHHYWQKDDTLTRMLPQRKNSNH
ncbi:cytochrome b [Colwellia sp. D2M02]|uniref:cytochrome b n=1 Tax=Colwellia sp. D2M02 TaxID=2841562 RepID=UPI001C08ACFB|nr:cytochrome b [Colwellia sp. D2M02]MBU2892732.1 cytochrome b [Colwellia sp. D2M02]